MSRDGAGRDWRIAREAFVKGEETRAFGPGDVLFVEAGVEHRFEDFSEDFAAWAIFWGPAGGEG